MKLLIVSALLTIGAAGWLATSMIAKPAHQATRQAKCLADFYKNTGNSLADAPLTKLPDDPTALLRKCVHHNPNRGSYDH